MADRFLKHVPSGVVFIYQSAFAANPDMVEVADVSGTALNDNVIEGEATRVVEEAVVEAKAKRAKAVSKKVAKGESVEQAEAEVASETDAQVDADLDNLDLSLSADASRGL